MHYYQHNIKDFRSGTYQMTRMERWIYRDMLDVIYDTEKPLPDSLDAICVALGVRSEEERKIVAELLLFKFVQVQGGYMNERAAEEIANFHKGTEKASAAGKASAAARANKKQPKNNGCTTTPEPSLNDGSTTVERPLNAPSTNQEPLTSNQDKTPHTPQGGIGEQSKTSLRKSGTTLSTFLADCKAKGERPLRDHRPLWDYCERVGLSEDFIALAWAEFVRRFTGDGTNSAKRQLDWRKKFRNYVENNYYKLWAINSDGVYFLTSQGKQAEKGHS